MTLPKPRAVIFDWDNTLVDTWPIIYEALVDTFKSMHMEPWTLEQTKARVRKSMRDSFPEVFGDKWKEAGDIYQRQYRASHLTKLAPLPLAREVLEMVKKQGLYSSVVSNKKGGTLRQEIENLGWDDLFDSIVGSDDAANDKPHTDPVVLAFKETHIKPASDVWFIGDSDIDLECAKNCGCTAILFGASAKDHPEYTQGHFLGFPYQAHLHDHTETLKLFAEI